MEDDDDDADAAVVSDGIATPFFFPAGPTTVVVRLRLMLAAVAAVTIGRFGGIIIWHGLHSVVTWSTYIAKGSINTIPT